MDKGLLLKFQVDKGLLLKFQVAGVMLQVGGESNS